MDYIDYGKPQGLEFPGDFPAELIKANQVMRACVGGAFLVGRLIDSQFEMRGTSIKKAVKATYARKTCMHTHLRARTHTPNQQSQTLRSHTKSHEYVQQRQTFRTMFGLNWKKNNKKTPVAIEQPAAVKVPNLLFCGHGDL